jgi:hypothetical protein
MSTRSRIAIVLKDEDLNKVMSPNVDLIYGEMFHEENFTPSLHDSMFETPVVSIYHHFDGYPKGLGVTLLDHYNSYEKALNLMLFGDASTILSDFKKEEIKFYNYWRGENWDNTRPYNSKDMKALKKSIKGGFEEFCYLYQPNEKGEYEWYVAVINSRITFKKLKDVLDKLLNRK